MFDACFMQCAEVAYALRDCANWIIASPAEIPGYGAPYDIVVPLFFDATASPQSIIDAYKAGYEGENTGVVLSAVRCAAMQQFADATAVAVKGPCLMFRAVIAAMYFHICPVAILAAMALFPISSI